MNVLEFFPSVGSIIVICFVIFELLQIKIPVSSALYSIVAACGGVLGFLGYILKIESFVLVDPFVAIAIGITSGILSCCCSDIVFVIKNNLKENNHEEN